MGYRLSRAAAKDIESLLSASLAEFGSAQTADYVSSLEGCLVLLAENPGLGAALDDVGEGYRRFPHQSHVVFYREVQGGIWVVRVLHQRMDPARHLR